MKTTALLDNWIIHSLPIKDKDGVVYRVATGNVYHDTRKRFHNGCYIHTSKVVSETAKFIFTLNSKYRKGKPYGEGNRLRDNEDTEASPVDKRS